MGGYRLIRVNGDSMAPTYTHGKLLLMRKFPSALKPLTNRNNLSKSIINRLKVDQVLVITAPNFPGVWQIKRLKRINYELKKIWVEGDNPNSTDSRSWGELDIKNIVGKVVLALPIIR